MFILVKQKKQLKERTNQHIDAVRKKSSLSLIFKLCQQFNHSFNFDASKILIQNSNDRPRRFLESFSLPAILIPLIDASIFRKFIPQS